MLAHLLLFANTFQFPGGTPAELVEAMAETTGRPIVMTVLDEPQIRGAKFVWDTPKRFGREARSFFGFRPVHFDDDAAASLGFGKAWSPSFLEGNDAKKKGELMVQGDTVTTRGEAVLGPASDFAQGDLHWYLSKVPVMVCVASSTKADLRAAVLAAVGADEKGQPRWPELRTRFADGFWEIGKERRKREEDPFKAGNGEQTWTNITEGYEMKALAYRQLSDKQMAAVFEKGVLYEDYRFPEYASVMREARGFFLRMIDRPNQENPGPLNTYADEFREMSRNQMPVTFRFTPPTEWKMMLGDDRFRVEFTLSSP